MSLFDLLSHCSAPRIIILQSYDVLANGTPKDLLYNSELISKGYIVLNIDVVFSFTSILIVEVCENG